MVQRHPRVPAIHPPPFLLGVQSHLWLRPTQEILCVLSGPEFQASLAVLSYPAGQLARELRPLRQFQPRLLYPSGRAVQACLVVQEVQDPPGLRSLPEVP